MMWGRDRGNVTVFMTLLVPAWIAMLGLVIVGGGRLRAYQRADNVAAEAARAAGSAINTGVAVAGGEKIIDPAKAASAAEAYLNVVGATGYATVIDGTHLRVTAVINYANPSGLEFIGGATWQATGVATVTLLVG